MNSNGAFSRSHRECESLQVLEILTARFSTVRCDRFLRNVDGHRPVVDKRVERWSEGAGERNGSCCLVIAHGSPSARGGIDCSYAPAITHPEFQQVHNCPQAHISLFLAKHAALDVPHSTYSLKRRTSACVRWIRCALTLIAVSARKPAAMYTPIATALLAAEKKQQAMLRSLVREFIGEPFSNC
jgi:hypothetical protein